jgi:peptidyl-prolyl cis-trans isomerase C
LRDKSPPAAPSQTTTLGPDDPKVAPNHQRIAMTTQIEALSPPSATQRRTPVRRGGLLAVAAALALILPGTPAGAQSAPSDPLIAKVNGVEVHQSDLAMAEEDMGQNAQAMTGDAKRDYLLQYISDVILAAQAAEAKKVNEQKEFKGRLAFMRNKLLMETLLQEEGKAAVTPEAMKKVYDEAAKQMGNEQEVRARHILVPTEEEAKAVLAEIKKGTDFAELAKQKSKDPGAAAEGGDLGYFTKDQMVPEFAEVAFRLEKGQVSDPVKTQFGWHIIKVEDKRTKPVPSFEQVKDQISTYVERKAQAEYIAKLREGAKIERLDKK